MPLIFDDEFDTGSAPSPDRYHFYPCWGNNNDPENDPAFLQGDTTTTGRSGYTQSALTIAGGLLTINGTTTATQYGGQTFPYRSGILRTKRTFLYGYFEVRGNFPAGANLYSIFWLMPPKFDDETIFEIDACEAHNEASAGYATNLHWGDGYGTPTHYQNLQEFAVDASGWHVWGMDWQEGWVRFYRDGVLVRELTPGTPPDGNQIPNVPMQVLISYNLGGPAPWIGPFSGTTPVNLQLDYIRVWTSKDEAMASPLAMWLINETSGTNAADSIAPPVDLTIVPGTASGWGSTAAGWYYDLGTSLVTALESGSVNGTKFSAADGVTKATWEFVITYDGAAPGSGGCVIDLTLNTNWLGVYVGATNTTWEIWITGGATPAFTFAAPTAGTKTVVHVAFDSTQDDEDDRVIVYYNATPQTKIIGSGIPEDTTLEVESGSVVSLGAYPLHQFGIDGRLHYGALYLATMAPAQVTANATALAANDDENPNAAPAEAANSFMFGG